MNKRKRQCEKDGHYFMSRCDCIKDGRPNGMYIGDICQYCGLIVQRKEFGGK